MGKNAFEKKFRNLHKNARALGSNEILLQAVTIEVKTVLLNDRLSHKFLTSLFSKSKEIQAEML